MELGIIITLALLAMVVVVVYLDQPYNDEHTLGIEWDFTRPFSNKKH